MKRNTSTSSSHTSDREPNRVSYTPGPYSFRRGTDGCDETYEIWAQRSRQHITAIHFWDLEEQSRANACLLASAPELVEALKLTDQWLRQAEHSLYEGSKLAHQVQSLIDRVTNVGADPSDQAQNDATDLPPVDR